MRTHFCGLVDETLIGQTVTLAGWTDVARNQGGVCFIDLRDHEGIVQVTVEVDNADVFAVAASLGYEDVLQVEGVVRARHAVKPVKKVRQFLPRDAKSRVSNDQLRFALIRAQLDGKPSLKREFERIG